MIWIISEIYYPDEDGTAFYLTRVAEYLACDYEVGVICGGPKYSARGRAVARKELRGRVRIERCMDIYLNKNELAPRVINALFISFSMFLKTVRKMRAGDIAIVVTNPPVLPFLALLACRIHSAKCILRVDDVYPEAIVAAGLLRPEGLAARAIGFLNGLLYRRMDRIVVLGRDMENLVSKRMNGNRSRIRLIQNWADTDSIKPSSKSGNRLLQELGLESKFVVLCAGNMGRVQAIETMLGAAERVKDEAGIHFLFIGQGAKREWMENEVRRKGLGNVTLLGYRPRGEQNIFLNACDISIAALIRGLNGAGVPSRLYNAMAAGKPLLAVAESMSELCIVVNEEQIGWCVSPDDPDGLAEVIKEAMSDQAKLEELGRRARRVAVEKYASDIILARYKSLVKGALSRGDPLRRKVGGR